MSKTPNAANVYSKIQHQFPQKQLINCYGIIDAVWTGKIKRCECFGSPKPPYTKGHNTPKVFKYAAKLHKKIDIRKSYADFFQYFCFFIPFCAYFAGFVRLKARKEFASSILVTFLREVDDRGFFRWQIVACTFAGNDALT